MDANERIRKTGIALILIMGSFAMAAYGQGVTFEKSIDANADDWGLAVQQTTDGGYIIAGGTYEEAFGYGDVYLVKTDPDGDVAWSKTFGGGFWDRGYAVQQTGDGGYIVTGNTWSASQGAQTDVYVIRTDANGEERWSRIYGGENWESSYSVALTDDGGFVIAGRTESFGPDAAPAVPNMYLLQLDAEGDTLWTGAYGGAGWDEAYEVQQTEDGGFVVVGITESFGAGNRDVYLLKVDADGNETWSRTFGGPAADEGLALHRTGDGGFILAGMTNGVYDCCDDAGFPFVASGNVFLVKTDAEGNEAWANAFGDADINIGHAVVPASDGGYVVAGETTASGGDQDVYLLRVDANGDLVWETTLGGAFDEIANSVQPTNDGGFILTGWTYGPSSGSETDVLLSKIESGGVGTDVADAQAGVPERFRLLQNYPNPFNPETTIRFAVPQTMEVKIVVYDITGRLVRSLLHETLASGEHAVRWNGAREDGRQAASGVYVVRMSAGESRHTLKVLLLR